MGDDRNDEAIARAMQEEEYAAGSTEAGSAQLRLLHLSDTHGMHRTVGKLPDADILIHTGDFTNHGLAGEIKDFDDWLGSCRGQFRHMFVILGNHDVRSMDSAERALAPGRMHSLLTNATVLDHELVEVDGLKIFGSNWCPSDPSAAPDPHPPMMPAPQSTPPAWPHSPVSEPRFDVNPR